MLNNIKKRNEGFTIIEVLIVLAIAGLILLVVFLAVPALQRNSRNQQRRTDASNILSAASEYVSNNSGTLPSSVSAGTGKVTLTASSGSPNTVDVKLGFFTPSDVSVATSYTAGTTVPNNADKIVILPNYTCNGNTPATETRSVAVVWRAEPTSVLCLAS